MRVLGLVDLSDEGVADLPLAAEVPFFGLILNDLFVQFLSEIESAVCLLYVLVLQLLQGILVVDELRLPWRNALHLSAVAPVTLASGVQFVRLVASSGFILIIGVEVGKRALGWVEQAGVLVRGLAMRVPGCEVGLGWEGAVDGQLIVVETGALEIHVRPQLAALIFLVARSSLPLDQQVFIDFLQRLHDVHFLLLERLKLAIALAGGVRLHL